MKIFLFNLLCNKGYRSDSEDILYKMLCKSVMRNSGKCFNSGKFIKILPGISWYL